jgi:hypothetical protein
MADVKISGLPASTTPLAGTEVLPIVQGGITKQVSVNNLTAGKDVSAKIITSTSGVYINGSSGTAPFSAAESNIVNHIASGNPQVRWVNKDAAADEKVYDWIATTTQLIGRAVNDTNGAANNWIEVDRTGFVIDSVNFPTVKLTTGNLVIGTSGRGIDFSANTGAAGMTSELLDWYEEGAWTPQLLIGNVAATQTSSGVYTRVGRLVCVTAIIENIDKGALTGLITIAGFPFTSITLAGARHTGTVSVNRFGLAANGTNLVMSLGSGQTEGVLYWNSTTNNNGPIATDVEILSSSTDIYFTLTYPAA